jgi:acyl carrier protein
MRTTEQRFRDLVVEKLGCYETVVTSDARFMDDLGCDSLDIVGLLIATEDGFGVEITDEDAEKCVTVGDAVALIERLRAGR